MILRVGTLVAEGPAVERASRPTATAAPEINLVQALGLSFTVSTLALAGSLAWRGALPLESLGLSALAVVPALAGMGVGQLVRDRISPPVFKRGFLVVLGLLGSEMILRAAV